MSTPARLTALRVLESCRTHGAWADAALKAQLSRDGLTGPDAALCSRIVYGVLQNQMLLDFYLAAYCSQKPDHLQPPLLNILRMGAYQILYLDKIPDSAAVNESVELAKILTQRGYQVLACEPFVRGDVAGFENHSLEEALAACDYAVVTLAHDPFKAAKDKIAAKPHFDCVGLLR